MIQIIITQCPTFAPVTIAPTVNPNVERNPNPNPNPYTLVLILILTLSQTLTLPLLSIPNQKPPKRLTHHPHSNSLLSELSSQEQLSLNIIQEQMSDHRRDLITTYLTKLLIFLRVKICFLATDNIVVDICTHNRSAIILVQVHLHQIKRDTIPSPFD